MGDAVVSFVCVLFFVSPEVGVSRDVQSSRFRRRTVARVGTTKQE